jgi:hypothetical protein
MKLRKREAKRLFKNTSAVEAGSSPNIRPKRVKVTKKKSSTGLVIQIMTGPADNDLKGIKNEEE